MNYKNSATTNAAPKKDFRQFLKSKINEGKCIFFDGGMGTMIQKTVAVKYAVPEDLNFYSPDSIENIHLMYLNAGCDIVTTNSFGANPIKLEHAAHSAEEYITKAVQIAHAAVQKHEAESSSTGAEQKPHYIAWDSGQIGKLMEPMGSLTFDEAYESYKKAAVTAEKAGADLALIETMSDLYEVKAAVLAIKENTSLPIIASMTFQPNLRTLTGADVETCVTYLESLGVDVLGFNCGGTLEEDEQLAQQYCTFSHIPVLVQPNAGLPVVIDGKDVFKTEPHEFALSQKKNFMTGAAVLGGCCGTTPAHIEEMVKSVSELTRTQNENKSDCARICSGNKTVRIGGTAGPVIVGERINPTGKKKCREALIAQNMDFILSEAQSQIEGGAHVLDVNTGLPEIDEAQMMLKAVRTIQSTFNTPLQIDSSEPHVIEKALRYYNGKPLVNSVNGKRESMDKIFPLIKKYGGAVVALCIDEDGIAPSAEGRVAVAKRIIAEAQKYGIQPRDIFIDTLTLTVSSEQKTALETVRAIKILHDEFSQQGLGFILGVSNISFGLPRRDIINSRFFMLALNAGLSACIINPASAQMMDTYRAYRTLAGFDLNCIDFINTYTGTLDPTTKKARDAVVEQALKNGTVRPAEENAQSANTAAAVPLTSSPQPSSATENSLSTEKCSSATDETELIKIIENGFKDRAAAVTERLLQNKKPVEIINGCIVPALDSVGKDFENGKKFLPQLLLSAETVGNSFSKIKENLVATGAKQESKGTIVLATVYGDIHDIGKNIVKAMLENYGYTVIDLGKNVPAQTIVDTVIKHNIQLVGLSALMTTTVANMEKTISLLKTTLSEHGKECAIVAGGAVLTEDYAKKIGADYYSKDAMETVAVAKKVFGK